MKFSSDDILQQEFEKKVRGYDPHQVREFLNGLAREWDHLVDELKRTRTEGEAAARELRDYRRRERSLHDALDMAKQVAEEVRHQAERDAELIVAEAELKSERILAGVQNRVVEMRGELMKLQEQRIRFEAELRATLDAHRRLLETFSPLEGGDSEASAEEVTRDEERGFSPNTEPGMSN